MISTPSQQAIHKILLADDDRALSSVLVAALREEGFEVDCVWNGLEALRTWEAIKPDLLILDVLMPEMDGLEVCRRVRKRSNIPIILLTSRGEEVDRITGLETGADDYVTKPFSIRELCARIRALARRLAREQTRAAPTSDEETLEAGPLSLDIQRFKVTWRGSAVVLTRSELQVLATLVRCRGRVLKRDALLDLARGDDAVVTDRTVDTLIKRIRKKITAVDPGFDEIETVIGIGYRYREPS